MELYKRRKLIFLERNVRYFIRLNIYPISEAVRTCKNVDVS